MASVRRIMQQIRRSRLERQTLGRLLPFGSSLARRPARRAQRQLTMGSSILLAAMASVAAASLLAAFVARLLANQSEREEIAAVMEPVGTLPDEEQALAALEAVGIAE